MNIDIGDNGRYNITSVGTVTFQRELGNPLTLKYVMYVPRLKKIGRASCRERVSSPV